jgi:hypothetical protein
MNDSTQREQINIFPEASAGRDREKGLVEAERYKRVLGDLRCHVQLQLRMGQGARSTAERCQGNIERAKTSRRRVSLLCNQLMGLHEKDL